MQKTKYLIVGAGVSGLAFANFCGSQDFIIVERDTEPGGYCKTIYQDGFTWDYSGHFFHFRNAAIQAYLTDRMPANSCVQVQKRSGIFFKGKYIDFPFQKNIHQLPKQDFIDCLYDLYLRPQNQIPTNFKDMLYQKFGNSIAELFLIPYNEKLYACDLQTLDTDAMGRFFPHANLDDIIRNFKQANNQSYNDTFLYPKLGAIAYIQALLQEIPAQQILYNCNLQHIDLDTHTAYTSQGPIQYEHLISSAPFNYLLQATATHTQGTLLSSNKVLVFNLGFDSKGLRDTHWVYYPQRDVVFYRIGYYDNILNEDRMSLYVEIGLPTTASVDVEASLQRVLANLKEVGAVTSQQLVSYHSVVMDPAYVHVSQAGQQLYQHVSAQWAQQSVYSIGRYGGWKYCSIEDNMIEARELAQHLKT